MKRSFLLVVILLAFNSIFANPVDFNRAKEMGQKFVSANFTQKSNSELELVYTVNSNSGEACFYVFNVSDHGYVMVSANDCARPILAYSEESVFDVNNIAPGLNDMMYVYQEAINYAIETKATATPDIVAEWKSLEASGKVKPAMKGQGVEPLCTTKWNQSWPYNYYCPEQSASWASNGHVVVGCVATAMAQIMRYWAHPTTGTGSHTYQPQGYPVQTVNFGATTYDWANMPDEIDSSSPVVEQQAVGLLGYHCGVAVDMMYDLNGSGSGAYTEDVPPAIQAYFGYAPSSVSYRDYSTTWEKDLKDCFDRGIPVYYAGVDEEGYGHAFVCDGYDDNDLFHFNFGWGGSGDGYFTTSAMDYHVRSSAVMNFVPMNFHNKSAKAPTGFTVTAADNNELSATLSWTNPSKFVNNTDITTIDKIVVERNGRVIHEENNATPGQTMTFVDNTVPCFSYFDYSVYAVVEEAHGYISKVEQVGFGPTCGWKLMLQSSAFQGMRGASVSVYDAAGAKFVTKTTTNSQLNTYDIQMPLGKLDFSWTPQSSGQADYTLNIIIKDPNGETVYNYSGSTENMESGVFFTANNTCGNDEQCDAPSNLTSATQDESIVLSWNGNGNPTYGYNVFRDGLLIALAKETTFTDTEVPFGGHCYTVTSLCEGGNSAHSNEVCGVTTEGCEPASELWGEVTSSNKAKIYWTKPENDELSGYYIMRKSNDETEWKRVKILGANKTDYTDGSTLSEGVTYSYRVVAYYQKTDCLSAPAKAKHTNDYFVRLSVSADVDDLNAAKVGVYPNPVDDNLTINAEGMKSVCIINMMGQKVYETSVNSDNVVLNMNNYQTGVYMIQVTTDEYKVTKRVSVVH